MKAVVLLCLVAAAAAQYYHPVTYGRHFYQPLTYSYIPQTVTYNQQSAGNVHSQLLLNKREAEADPQYFYSSGYHYPSVYHTPYTAHHYTPYMYKPSMVAHTKQGVYADDASSSFNYAAKGHYYANSAGTIHKAKREAEANHHYGYYPQVYSPVYHHYQPYYYVQPMHLKSYSNDAVKPQTYAAKGQYHAETAGSVHIAKREAEANHHYGFYYPQVYSAPVAYHYQPYHFVKPMHLKTYSNDAVKPQTYAAKGQYHAETAGSVHIAKREAEPFTTYSTFGHTYQPYNFGYRHHLYNSYYPYTYYY